MINLNSLTINKEMNTTWIIPEQNILDINYTIKEEKNSEIKTERNNNSISQMKLESDKTQKNSIIFKKLNLNLNINKSNTRTKIKNDKNSKNKSHALKIKNFFFPQVMEEGSIHTKIKNISKNNDDIDEQSYAFENLVNLNKDKSVNEKMYTYKTIDEDINYNYNYKIKRKKKIESDLDKKKIFLIESKKYFNDDKQLKENNDIRKNSDSIKSQLKLEFPSYKKKEHKSLKFNQTRKNKNQDTLQYDGDMETITFRDRDNYKNQIERKSTYESNNNANNKIQEQIIQEKRKSENLNKNNKNTIHNIHNKTFNYIKNKNEKEYIEIIEPKKINLENSNRNRALYNYPTLCEGFIISGISKILTEEKIIKDSSDFLSTCGHKSCSSLFSIQPEILFFYKNEKLTLSEEKKNNIVKLSFPTGVKICLENKLDQKKIRHFPQQIFFNIIQDDNGEILYLCTIYHFIKITPNEFIQTYNNDISLFYSELFKKLNPKKNNIFEHCYIPEAITLITRYPFFNAIEICLNGFLSPYIKDRNNLLNHLIHEVPIPYENEQIKFFVLLFSTPVILNHKMNLYKVMTISNKEKQNFLLNNNYLTMEGIDFNKLLSNISIEHIIFLFGMILLEQKILFVYKDYEKITKIIFIFISLIFPFSLKNNIYPMLSLDNISTLEKQNYFIAGMDESLFAYINRHDIKIGNDVIIYNISLNNFISSKNKKKASRKDLLNEYKLFTLPEKVTNFLLKELKLIFKEINSNLNLYIKYNNEESSENYSKLTAFKQHIEFETKLIFMKSINMLINDIDNYLFFTEEQFLFNKNSFIENHKEKDFKNFLNLFINTNLFNDFLNEQKIIYFSQIKNYNDNEDIHIGKNKYSKEKINLDVFYYNKISKNFKDLKNNNNQTVNTSINIANIITNDIKSKAENICKNLQLINETIIKPKNGNNNNETNDEININNNITQESVFRQRNKSNSLITGKNYLEDKINNKKKSIENNNNMIDSYLSHKIKESKLSTEASTLNTYNKSIINKSEKSKEKSKNNNNKLLISKNIQKNINNKKNKEIKKYLLSPYFLNINTDDEYYIKEHKDEQIILKEIEDFKNKKNIKDKFPPYNIMLYINFKFIEYNKYLFKKDKAYIINNNMKEQNYNKDMNKSKFDNELYSFKKIFYKTKNNENEIMNLKELMTNDDKIILINKLFKYCFEQKMDLQDIYLPYIQKLFSNIENLEYFSNLIVPDNLLKLNNYQKQLNAISFNSFSKIIKIAFEHINISDKNLGFLLTLSCFIYYKIDKGKIIYLYNEFSFNKLNQVQKPYQLWCNEIFWIEFFNSEFEFINKENNYIDNDINNNSDESDKEKNEIIDINYNKKMCLIKSVLLLSNIMLKLNIDKNFVINIIEKMILPVFVNDFYFINEIMKLALISNRTI